MFYLYWNPVLGINALNDNEWRCENGVVRNWNRVRLLPLPPPQPKIECILPRSISMFRCIALKGMVMLSASRLLRQMVADRWLLSHLPSCFNVYHFTLSFLDFTPPMLPPILCGMRTTGLFACIHMYTHGDALRLRVLRSCVQVIIFYKYVFCVISLFCLFSSDLLYISLCVVSHDESDINDDLSIVYNIWTGVANWS